jgi:hypothetical protein
MLALAKAPELFDAYVAMGQYSDLRGSEAALEPRRELKGVGDILLDGDRVRRHIPGC